MPNNHFRNYLDGLTPAKRLIAAEAVEVYLQGESEEVEKITSPADVWKSTRFLANKDTEHVVAIYLNARGAVLDKKILSSGSVNASICDIRVLLKEAFLLYATSVILVHNHPSGALKPSKEDDKLTQYVQKACEVVRLRFCDHVIVTDKNYYSYQENGKL